MLVSPHTEQVRALHLLGPDYQSTFSPLESSAVLEQAHKGLPSAAAMNEVVDIISGREALGGRLILSYSARVPFTGSPI